MRLTAARRVRQQTLVKMLSNLIVQLSKLIAFAAENYALESPSCFLYSLKSCYCLICIKSSFSDFLAYQ
jgi:hypothetical protein